MDTFDNHQKTAGWNPHFNPSTHRQTQDMDMRPRKVSSDRRIVNQTLDSSSLEFNTGASRLVHKGQGSELYAINENGGNPANTGPTSTQKLYEQQF